MLSLATLKGFLALLVVTSVSVKNPNCRYGHKTNIPSHQRIFLRNILPKHKKVLLNICYRSFLVSQNGSKDEQLNHIPQTVFNDNGNKVIKGNKKKKTLNFGIFGV